MDMMSLKDRILQEIMEDLDSQDGMKLKPKGEISMMSVKPSDGMEPDGDESSNPLGGDESQGCGDDDEDDLRRLIEEYSK